jgi:hypothetical protein
MVRLFLKTSTIVAFSLGACSRSYFGRRQQPYAGCAVGGVGFGCGACCLARSVGAWPILALVTATRTGGLPDGGILGHLMHLVLGWNFQQLGMA